MLESESKLNEISNKLIETIRLYADLHTKVIFMGVSLYPNSGNMINWDILYLYRSLLEAQIETRLHDPHIEGSKGLSMGFWLGRQSKEENWTHSYDCVILSCPHVFYVTNILKLAPLFKDNKPCILIDLYGIFTKIDSIGEYIEVMNFSTEYDKGDILGGLYPINKPKLLN